MLSDCQGQCDLNARVMATRPALSVTHTARSKIPLEEMEQLSSLILRPLLAFLSSTPALLGQASVEASRSSTFSHPPPSSASQRVLRFPLFWKTSVVLRDTGRQSVELNLCVDLMIRQIMAHREEKHGDFHTASYQGRLTSPD